MIVSSIPVLQLGEVPHCDIKTESDMYVWVDVFSFGSEFGVLYQLNFCILQVRKVN